MWRSPWTRSGAVLGFALGGFFDGILLHQILQWHHLLSLVPAVGDLRMQVLWDGYFHALMYVIAALGLWGLWRAHKRSGEVRGGRLAGALLIGFGLWHVIDGIVSHWVLSIHRINLQSPNPLAWDLIWFVVFGVAPLMIGWKKLRDEPPFTHPTNGSAAAVLVLSVVTAGAAAWSLKPPANQHFTTVAFASSTKPHQVLAAVAAADARLVWTDRTMRVVVVVAPPDRRWSFYRAGALLVSGAGAPAGCLAWSRI